MSTTPTRRTWRLFAVAVLAALTLTACLATPTPSPTPTPTRPPRPTFTPVPPTPPIPPATATATARPATATATLTPAPLVTATPTVDPAVNPLTGLRVADPTVLQKRPIHICIDNDPTSRPHFGLNQADIVYEYIMERFYNTRLTAVYWGQSTDRIGPVRSARLVNTELTPQYDALLACQGASDPTRWLLITDKSIFDYTYLDIDLFDPQYRYFTIYGKNPRIGTNLVQASIESLRKWLQDNKKEKTVTIKGFTFSSAPPPPQTMPATTIKIPFPQSCCAVQWTYDAAKGRYLRTMDNEPHLDGATKEQISAANVIVLYAEYQNTDIVEDSTGATAYRIMLRGEGKVTVFRDGVAILAFWKRNAITDFTQIVDAQGKPIPLRPGNSWIELVPDQNFEVTFK